MSRLRESNVGTDPFTPISQRFAASIRLRETFAWVEAVTTNGDGGSINGSSSLNFRHVSVFLSPAGSCPDVSPEPDGFRRSWSAGGKQAAKRRRELLVTARYWSLVPAGSGGPDEVDVVGPAPHLSPVVPARSFPFPHFSWIKSSSGCSN